MPSDDIKIIPQRGEVWRVDFDSPNENLDEDSHLTSERVGDEIMKARPAVVISQPKFSHLDLCTVVPITRWKPWHNDAIGYIAIPQSEATYLTKNSSFVISQVQTISYSRFEKQLGLLNASWLQEVCAGIAVGIQYECP